MTNPIDTPPPATPADRPLLTCSGCRIGLKPTGPGSPVAELMIDGRDRVSHIPDDHRIHMGPGWLLITDPDTTPADAATSAFHALTNPPAPPDQQKHNS